MYGISISEDCYRLESMVAIFSVSAMSLLKKFFFGVLVYCVFSLSL